MNGICKLCGKEKKLCSQSHIIPNFMYNDLFDHDNRMNEIQSKKGTIHRKGTHQTGEFDKHILCQTCDNDTIGKLDRYASLILYDGYPKILEQQISLGGLRYTNCTDLDYTQFKLFLLSILWRASISSRPFFSEVHLGPHEGRIRQMLLESDPSEQLEYPCLIMTYLNLNDFPVDIVSQPSLSRVDGGYIYKFLIGGMIYIFYVSKHIIPSQLSDFAINRDGELKIIHFQPRVAKRIFSDMLGIDLK